MSSAQIQLCFGEVRHRRLRPVAHAFNYPVYFLRVPLRVAHAGDGQSRWFSRNRFNLLSFHDADHGDGQQPLTTWIDGVLRQHGVDDADGEIWLQTFPRVFGYVFNPVSFWFCHRIDGCLRAVLCQVRNTFGEQHCYLLDTGATLAYGTELHARKIFHVSPFCAVEGGYRFRFMRSVADAAVERWVARIEHDDAAGPLLLTSIGGRAGVLDNRSVLRAFFGMPCMTLGVIARIHWQALQLWRKRVRFLRKPAPPIHSISR